MEELAHLQGLSRQVIDYFGDIPGKVDDLRFKICKVMLVLSTLKQELTNLETKLNILEEPKPLTSKIWSNSMLRET